MKCVNAIDNGRITTEVQMSEFRETGNDCVDGVMTSTLKAECHGCETPSPRRGKVAMRRSVETSLPRRVVVHGLEPSV